MYEEKKIYILHRAQDGIKNYYSLVNISQHLKSQSIELIIWAVSKKCRLALTANVPFHDLKSWFRRSELFQFILNRNTFISKILRKEIMLKVSYLFLLNKNNTYLPGLEIWIIIGVTSKTSSKIFCKRAMVTIISLKTLAD